MGVLPVLPGIRAIGGVGADVLHYPVEHAVLLKRIRDEFHARLLLGHDEARIGIAGPHLRKKWLNVRHRRE